MCVLYWLTQTWFGWLVLRPTGSALPLTTEEKETWGTAHYRLRLSAVNTDLTFVIIIQIQHNHCQQSHWNTHTQQSVTSQECGSWLIQIWMQLSRWFIFLRSNNTVCADTLSVKSVWTARFLMFLKKPLLFTKPAFIWSNVQQKQ